MIIFDNHLFLKQLTTGSNTKPNYYAFGMAIQGRKFSGSSGYRYGFNGKENDKETVGTGEGTQDYGMRIYNPSLGKFLSVDPLTKSYPYLTPYAFAENSPILNIDLDGLEKIPSNKEKNRASLIKIINEYDSQFEALYKQTVHGTVGGPNKNQWINKKEVGSQVVQDKNGKTKRTQDGMQEHADDGTMKVKKPLMTGEEFVLVDWHSHPTDPRPFANDVDGGTPPSVEDIFNAGFISGASISIIETKNYRYAITIDDRAKFTKYNTKEMMAMVNGIIGATIKQEKDAYVKTNGSMTGFNFRDAYMKAISSAFAGQDLGITIYESKIGDKKVLTEIK